MKENRDHHQVVMSTENYELLVAAANGTLQRRSVGEVLKEIKKVDRHVRKFNYWRRVWHEQEVLEAAVALKDLKQRTVAFLNEWQGKVVVFTNRVDGQLYGRKVIVVGPSRYIKHTICAREENNSRRPIHATLNCFMTIDAFNDLNREKFNLEEAARREEKQ